MIFLFFKTSLALLEAELASFKDWAKRFSSSSSSLDHPHNGAIKKVMIMMTILPNLWTVSTQLNFICLSQIKHSWKMHLMVTSWNLASCSRRKRHLGVFHQDPIQGSLWHPLPTCKQCVMQIVILSSASSSFLSSSSSSSPFPLYIHHAFFRENSKADGP